MSQVASKNQGDTNPVKEFHFSYETYDLLKNRLSNLDCRSDQDWLNAREWIAAQIKQAIPKEISTELESFAENPNRSALIIRGCPIDTSLPPTPYHGYLETDYLSLASAIHIGIYQIAGIEPISYQNENNGNLFRHVVPARYARDHKSSHGSHRTFGMHVDNPDLPLTPENITDRSGSPEFLPREDGTDRWLIRLFGMSNISRIASTSEETPHIDFD